MSIDALIYKCEENAKTHEAFTWDGSCQEKASEYSQIADCLRELKSLKDQRTGHWLARRGGQFLNYSSQVCSCCKEKTYCVEFKYCPNCGAKMEPWGENEDCETCKYYGEEFSTGKHCKVCNDDLNLWEKVED